MFLLLFSFTIFPFLLNLTKVTAAQSDEEQQLIDAASQIFVNVAKMAKTSVVNIYTEKVISQRSPLRNWREHPFFQNDQLRDFFGEDFFEHFFGQTIPREDMIQRSLGSGVIVSSDGYILTNNHVVKDADKVIPICFLSLKNNIVGDGFNPVPTISILSLY